MVSISGVLELALHLGRRPRAGSSARLRVYAALAAALDPIRPRSTVDERSRGSREGDSNPLFPNQDGDRRAGRLATYVGIVV